MKSIQIGDIITPCSRCRQTVMTGAIFSCLRNGYRSACCTGCQKIKREAMRIYRQKQHKVPQNNPHALKNSYKISTPKSCETPAGGIGLWVTYDVNLFGVNSPTTVYVPKEQLEESLCAVKKRLEIDLSDYHKCTGYETVLGPTPLMQSKHDIWAYSGHTFKK